MAGKMMKSIYVLGEHSDEASLAFEVDQRPMPRVR